MKRKQQLNENILLPLRKFLLMNTFEELGLNSSILESIKKIGFEHPSPIQSEVIPFLLNETGDMVGLAQTGTGKTAAFALPMLQLTDENNHKTQGLILAPTRELCVQIATEMGRYASQMPKVKIVAVYGGEDIRKQLKQLDIPPHILVATPGRLLDLIKRKKVSLADVNTFVLDEADEMLNMGFLDDITEIFEQTPPTRRCLLFSATMPPEIANIAKKYLREWKEFSVGKRGESAKNIEHLYVITKPSMRYDVLKRILDYNPDIYGIVFCRTRQETKDVAEKLMADGYNADALHGDLSQAQRDLVMNKFRIKNLQILVATDVAARGLDVNDLTHVIHYNLPDDKETYTHRSGRTGRINKSGISIAIITAREKAAIKRLEKSTNKAFKEMEIPSGMVICQKQIIHLVNKMLEIQQDEKLRKFMPDIMEMLKDMDKEEIIGRFISVEFNRFLDYYKNAPDLGAAIRKSVREEEFAEGGSRKKSRREIRQSDKGDSIRLKINRGRNDGMNPRALLGLINDVVRDRSLPVDNIDISPKFSFFDIKKSQVGKVMRSFENSSRASGIVISEVKGKR